MLYIRTWGLIKRFLQYNAHYYSASDSRWCKHKRNLLKRCWVAPRISRKILGSGVMYPGTVPQVPPCNRASDDTSALLTTRPAPPRHGSWDLSFCFGCFWDQDSTTHSPHTCRTVTASPQHSARWPFQNCNRWFQMVEPILRAHEGSLKSKHLAL